jgi:hypothetical protein
MAKATGSEETSISTKEIDINKQYEVANERFLYLDQTNYKTFASFVRLIAAITGGGLYLYFNNINEPRAKWILAFVPPIVAVSSLAGTVIILANWKWMLDVRLSEVRLLGDLSPHLKRIEACGTELVHIALMLITTLAVSVLWAIVVKAERNEWVILISLLILLSIGIVLLTYKTILPERRNLKEKLSTMKGKLMLSST